MVRGGEHKTQQRNNSAFPSDTRTLQSQCPHTGLIWSFCQPQIAVVQPAASQVVTVHKLASLKFRYVTQSDLIFSLGSSHVK